MKVTRCCGRCMTRSEAGANFCGRCGAAVSAAGRARRPNRRAVPLVLKNEGEPFSLQPEFYEEANPRTREAIWKAASERGVIAKVQR